YFSSRRRHTRSKRDWSSDVCSSDLTVTLVSDLGGQAVQLNKALRGSLVESITGVVGSQREVVQRLWRTTAVDDDLTCVQHQANRSEERRVGKEGSEWRGAEWGQEKG